MPLQIPPTASNAAEWMRKAAGVVNTLLRDQNVMPVFSTAPTSPRIGQYYFDSTLSRARIWDGTLWQNLY